MITYSPRLSGRLSNVSMIFRSHMRLRDCVNLKVRRNRHYTPFLGISLHNLLSGQRDYLLETYDNDIRTRRHKNRSRRVI